MAVPVLGSVFEEEDFACVVQAEYGDDEIELAGSAEISARIRARPFASSVTGSNEPSGFREAATLPQLDRSAKLPRSATIMS